MSRQNNAQKGQPWPQMAEVFGFQVPVSDYYLHQGHAWVVVENEQRVRVGLDDFSQKILGPADQVNMPQAGKVYYQDHICLALSRQKRLASVLAPIDGIVEVVNPDVCRQPGLIHDDPYGQGWLFLMKPINLQPNLEKLSYGEANAVWIDQESHRLLNLLGPAVTLPDGGAIVDDVFGHYPQLLWGQLVRDFLLPLLSKGWKKRS